MIELDLKNKNEQKKQHSISMTDTEWREFSDFAKDNGYKSTSAFLVDLLNQLKQQTGKKS